MPRALLLVLDSVGCGGAEDAALYGDAGSDTLGHLAAACSAGRGDREGLRRGPLRLPNLGALGLGLAAEASTGIFPEGLPPLPFAESLWGYAVERAAGKDTPSGHWEMAGAPPRGAWRVFPASRPSFPPELTHALIAEGGLPGILGDCHASGVDIIERCGEEHMRTGKPICYTSADSVFQIAAHEDSFGLDRLYDLCGIARRLCDPLAVGRVIARPFSGAAPRFTRTPRRKDLALPPPPGNLLERLASAGRQIVSIGKIGDIFAHRFTGREIKRANDHAHFDATLEALCDLPDGGFIFTNFVDLDTNFGHRRDIAGYAHGLESLDARLPELLAAMREGDIAIISADHGNDPTWTGADHTREHAPILCFGPGLPGGPIGRRESFADIGASLAAHLGVASPAQGRSWLAPNQDL
ncbi:phosphopentomutase [Methylocapsa palsarum]|uniref:Phosphopentomutase n=1 Tax=Methylocapsa palsarum TaxID=1612308 RepID=A0A1I3W0N0_9HYPH|nr:phosphopentomutase [Methylocapsa palsarum]SFK00980.1 phosphopentomutase [Methylocapsa palsarum]